MRQVAVVELLHQEQMVAPGEFVVLLHQVAEVVKVPMAILQTIYQVKV
jgi:hypothetical protein